MSSLSKYAASSAGLLITIVLCFILFMLLGQLPDSSGTTIHVIDVQAELILVCSLTLLIAASVAGWQSHRNGQGILVEMGKTAIIYGAGLGLFALIILNALSWFGSPYANAFGNASEQVLHLVVACVPALVIVLERIIFRRARHSWLFVIPAFTLVTLAALQSVAIFHTFSGLEAASVRVDGAAQRVETVSANTPLSQSAHEQAVRETEAQLQAAHSRAQSALTYLNRNQGFVVTSLPRGEFDRANYELSSVIERLHRRPEGHSPQRYLADLKSRVSPEFNYSRGLFQSRNNDPRYDPRRYDDQFRIAVTELGNYLQHQEELFILTHERSAAQAHLEHVQQDLEILKNRQTPWLIPFVLLLSALALLPVLAVWHIAQVDWESSGRIRRLTLRLYGYVFMAYTSLPVLFAVALGVVIVVFSGRMSPGLHDIEADAQILIDDAQKDVQVVKRFVHDEAEFFRDIARDITRIERRISNEIDTEFRIVTDEFKKDYALIRDGVVSVEQQVVGEVRNAVGREVDKIKDAFTIDLGFFGKIDLGIGDWLVSLMPDIDFGIGDFFKSLGSQIIQSMKEPFMEPLNNLKALEMQIERSVNGELGNIEAQARERLDELSYDVSYLKRQLESGMAELIDDVRELARDLGFLAMQLAWFLVAVLCTLLILLLYMLTGWLFTYSQQWQRAIELVRQDINESLDERIKSIQASDQDYIEVSGQGTRTTG